jgi:hypothetical protein
VFEHDGKYVAQNTLSVGPAWGFPLREKTTYAFIVLDRVHAASGTPLRAPPLLGELLGADPGACAVPSIDGALHERLLQQFAPLRKRLQEDGIDPQRVVAATVFTTLDVTPELQQIYSYLEGGGAEPALNAGGWQKLDTANDRYARGESFRWREDGQSVDFHVFEGRYNAPNFQQGVPPYASRGGALNFDDDGPVPAVFEDMRFFLSVPKDPPRDGPCYPIVEYSHGTTGDAATFLGWHDDEKRLQNSTAGRLAARGMAAVGIDQPLHGTRYKTSSNELRELYSFNFYNPDAAVSTFRQAAIDTFVLTRLLRGDFKVPADKSPTGSDICFQQDNIGYFGHSQGGITGSIAAAFEKNINAWVLSGAGGGFAISLFERVDPPDLRAVLANVLKPAEFEDLSELHPMIGMVQWLADVTDPINYAPYWNKYNEYNGPQSMLLTSGEADYATPYQTATALIVAGHVPLVGPQEVDAPALEFAPMMREQAPLQGNLGDETAGFLQYTSNGEENSASHFLIFYRPEAIHASMRFLESAAFEATAIIERIPDSSAR